MVLNIIQRHNLFQRFASIGRVDLVWPGKTYGSWDFGKKNENENEGRDHSKIT